MPSEVLLQETTAKLESTNRIVKAMKQESALLKQRSSDLGMLIFVSYPNAKVWPKPCTRAEPTQTNGSPGTKAQEPNSIKRPTRPRDHSYAKAQWERDKRGGGFVVCPSSHLLF